MYPVVIGIIFGVFMGFYLHKGKMLSYDDQVSSMIFKKMNLIKFYMSAQLVSLTCLTILRILGVIQIDHTIFNGFNIIVGGLLFGVGWGVLGYCPGTCTGAIGAGKIDGIFGAIGILCGCIVNSICLQFIASFAKKFSYGPLGIDNIGWLISSTIVLFIVYMFIFREFERRNL